MKIRLDRESSWGYRPDALPFFPWQMNSAGPSLVDINATTPGLATRKRFDAESRSAALSISRLLYVNPFGNIFVAVPFGPSPGETLLVEERNGCLPRLRSLTHALPGPGSHS